MKLVLGLLLLGTGGGAFSFCPQEAGSQGQPIPITHSDPKFRMTVPAGYKPAAIKPPDANYAFQRLDGQVLAITVSILDGRIDPEELKESDVSAAALKRLPPGAQLRLSRESWGDHQLQIIETSFTMQGVEAFSLVAQVPILPRAVQISIGGQKSSEKQARDDLKAVLRSFRGTTHWLTPNQRVWAALAGGSAILSWLLLLIYGILYALRWRGGDALSHWRFRVIYLTATVAMFSLSIATGVAYDTKREREAMGIGTYVLTGVALACAIKTGDLYKKGLELRQKAAAAAPAPPA